MENVKKNKIMCKSRNNIKMCWNYFSFRNNLHFNAVSGFNSVWKVHANVSPNCRIKAEFKDFKKGENRWNFFFVQTNIYYSCHALDNVAFPPNHYCQRDVKPSREKYGRIQLHSLTILLIYGIEAVFCTHICMCIICGENGYQHIS